MDIFNTALYVMITIFVLVIIYLVGVNVISANVYPLMYHLRPTNNTTGISESMYVEKLDHLRTGFFYIFFIIIGSVFVYFIVKLLYEKEETSVYRGVYQ